MQPSRLPDGRAGRAGRSEKGGRGSLSADAGDGVLAPWSTCCAGFGTPSGRSGGWPIAARRVRHIANRHTRRVARGRAHIRRIRSRRPGGASSLDRAMGSDPNDRSPHSTESRCVVGRMSPAIRRMAGLDGHRLALPSCVAAVTPRPRRTNGKEPTDLRPARDQSRAGSLAERRSRGLLPSTGDRWCGCHRHRDGLGPSARLAV